MANLSITDRVNTFTYAYGHEEEQPIWNDNQVVTIGGQVKSQADSQRLAISIKMRLTQTELTSLNAILSNFSQTLYYTPSRKLAYKSAITELTVISKAPVIEDRAWNGDITFFVTLNFEEVI